MKEQLIYFFFKLSTNIIVYMLLNLVKNSLFRLFQLNILTIEKIDLKMCTKQYLILKYL